MKRNVPYAIVIPIAVVCFAVMLMLWSMAGTSGGRDDRRAADFAGSQSRSNQEPVRVPTMPSNDTAADSARTPNTPLNKSR
jgi:hypothetical protein